MWRRSWCLAAAAVTGVTIRLGEDVISSEISRSEPVAASDSVPAQMVSEAHDVESQNQKKVQTVTTQEQKKVVTQNESKANLKTITPSKKANSKSKKTSSMSEAFVAQHSFILTRDALQHLPLKLACGYFHNIFRKNGGKESIVKLKFKILSEMIQDPKF
jgi:hypothetical protein